MNYKPRKRKLAPGSRTKIRNISVRAVLKEEPDVRALARALLSLTDEQRQAMRQGRSAQDEPKA